MEQHNNNAAIPLETQGTDSGVDDESVSTQTTNTTGRLKVTVPIWNAFSMSFSNALYASMYSHAELGGERLDRSTNRVCPAIG